MFSIFLHEVVVRILNLRCAKILWYGMPENYQKHRWPKHNKYVMLQTESVTPAVEGQPKTNVIKQPKWFKR